MSYPSPGLFRDFYGIAENLQYQKDNGEGKVVNWM